MNLNSKHDPLHDALAGLRSVYNEEPPARIEAFLAARLNAARRRRKAIRLWRTVAAISAAAMLLFWLGTRPVEPRRRTTPAASVRQTQVASHSREFMIHPAGGAESVAVALRPERPPQRKRQRRADPERVNAAVPAPFIAIPYTEPLAPSEQLDIYRVQLPRVTLSLYGLPARAGDVEAPITADVAVGSNGVVRAVRFVR